VTGSWHALAPTIAAASPGATAARIPAPVLRGVGLLTGWGDGPPGLHSGLPHGARGLVPAPTPALPGERFRRATRECLLAVAATRAAVTDAGLDPAALAGDRTGILYVSATGYAAANRAFLEDEASTTLHFPYTSPSSVPAEVTIEFGVRGPYVNLMGGAPAALQGLWYAARWLATGAADRVLVLAVEAVHEVRDLFARARRLYRGPLVEGAVALVLDPGSAGEIAWASGVATGAEAGKAVADVLDAVLAGTRPALVVSGASGARLRDAEERALVRGAPAATGWRLPGEPLALGPLAALARARATAAALPWLVTATWQNDYGALLWGGGLGGGGRC
jgi:Beta-ketoacyl synthase, N-terminal domain